MGASFVSTLKNLKDLTASSSNEVPQHVRDELLKISERFSSIQEQLIAAQMHAIEHNERHQKLQDKLNRMNDWNALKARYSLQKVRKRTYVYALKPECQESEPDHWLCTKCFQAERHSILQSVHDNENLVSCLHCEFTFNLDPESAF